MCSMREQCRFCVRVQMYRYSYSSTADIMYEYTSTCTAAPHQQSSPPYKPGILDYAARAKAARARVSEITGFCALDRRWFACGRARTLDACMVPVLLYGTIQTTGRWQRRGATTGRGWATLRGASWLAVCLLRQRAPPKFEETFGGACPGKRAHLRRAGSHRWSSQTTRRTYSSSPSSSLFWSTSATSSTLRSLTQRSSPVSGVCVCCVHAWPRLTLSLGLV